MLARFRLGVSIANTVYGGGKQGAWKWTGRGFEVISDAERQEYDLAGHNGEHLIWGEKDGWTAQAVNPICDLKIPVKDALLEIHRNVESSKSLITIKFAGLPEVTWETPSRPVLVGRESYDAMFRFW
jgi:hypothetical protein